MEGLSTAVRDLGAEVRILKAEVVRRRLLVEVQADRLEALEKGRVLEVNTIQAQGFPQCIAG